MEEHDAGCLLALGGLEHSGGDLFDATAADDVAVGEGGGLEFPGEGPRVHAGEAEGGIVAIVPFVVVEQGPEEVAAHVVSVLARLLHGGNVFLEVTFALGLVLRGNPVFGDHHGFAVTLADETDLFVEAGRIDLPTHFGEVRSAVGSESECRDGTGLLAVVIVEADHVADVPDLVEVVEIHPHHAIVGRTGGIEPSVAPPGQCLHRHDNGIRAVVFDHGGGLTKLAGTGPHCRGVGAEGGGHGRRPLSVEIRGGDLAVRFVLRGEITDVRLESGDDFVHVGLPAGVRVGVQPVRAFGIFLVVEPVGESEVPKADNRFDAGCLEATGHLDVAPDGGLVIPARLRLDAGPLQAEAVMGGADFFERGHVFVEFAPRHDHGVAARHRFSLLHEDVPVGAEGEVPVLAGLAVLVLPARGGKSPGKVARVDTGGLGTGLRRDGWRLRRHDAAGEGGTGHRQGGLPPKVWSSVGEKGCKNSHGRAPTIG